MKPAEAMVRAFAESHPEDAARAVEALQPAEAAGLIKNLPVGVVALLLERVNRHVAASLFSQFEQDVRQRILTELPPRAAAGLLDHLDPTERQELVNALPAQTARWLNDLAQYPAETAGGMMEAKVVSLPIDLSVQQAIATIRKAPRAALHYLYVTDRSGALTGVLTMRDLLLAQPREPIGPLVRRPVLSIPATLSRDEVLDLMRERKFLAVPVVDFENRLIGVVKHDDAMQLGQLEAFEDLQKIVGAGSDERALSPVSTVVKRRLPWLYVNLLTAFMAASVVGLFEGIIQQVTALAVLLPIVSGQGGNSGSQSLAVVMRGLALRELVPGTAGRVILKEVLAATINGVSVAFVTGLAVHAWNHNLGLSLVIGLAMIVNMVAAAFAGAIVPLVLRALGRDPAQSASIFLTTVTDIVGFASFLGFALLFLKTGWLVPG